MKIPSLIYGALTAACVMGIALPWPASAQVSTNDFEALKKIVEQMGDRLQKLEQTHEQDQKTHEQDQQVIQQLQKQLGETKTAVTNAQLTADNVAKAQAALPPPACPRGRCTTSPSSAMPRFNLAKLRDSTTHFNWPILRLFSSFAPAMMSSSRQDSTPCSIITRT